MIAGTRARRARFVIGILAGATHLFALEVSAQQPAIHFSSEFGGSRRDIVTGVTGNETEVLVVGGTLSPDFQPSSDLGEHQESQTGAFVFKLGIAHMPGFVLMLGNDGDAAFEVAMAPDGLAFVLGQTFSATFPVVGPAPQSDLQGPSDLFLSVVAPDGTLLFSSYLGGSGEEVPGGIAQVDDTRLLIGATTTSVDLPIVNAARADTLRGESDGYLLILDWESGVVELSSYIGGTGDDSISGIAIVAGTPWIVGTTSSEDVDEHPRSLRGGGQDGFIAAVAPTSLETTSFSYFGGPADERLTAVDTDGREFLYATGQVRSAGLASEGAYQADLGGNSDAIIIKFDTRSERTVYSSYFGGTSVAPTFDEFGTAIQARPDGTFVVVGRTNSDDFPLKAPLQSRSDGLSDGFLASFDSSGVLLYSSFLGGSASESATALSLTTTGRVIVAGNAGSDDFPFIGPLLSTTADLQRGFLTEVFEDGLDLCAFVVGGDPVSVFPTRVATSARSLGTVIARRGQRIVGGVASADGRFLYMINAGTTVGPEGGRSGMEDGSQRFSRGITILDSATLDVLADVELPQRPRRAALTSDDSTLFVVGTREIYLIDTSSMSPTSTVEGLSIPTDIVISQATGLVYAADLGAESIAVLDSSGESVREVQLPAGTEPIGIGLGEEDELVVLDGNNSRLLLVDNASGRVGSSIALEAAAFEISVAGDLAIVNHALHRGLYRVSLVDLMTKAVVRELVFERRVSGPALPKETGTAYMVEEGGSFILVDLATGNVRSKQVIGPAIERASSLVTTRIATGCSIGLSLRCPSDCNEDAQVAISELVIAVRIALGQDELATCEAADVDGNATVDINELIVAVRAALDGCE